MTIEDFVNFVRTHNHFASAINLNTHLHEIQIPGTSLRLLSYFNQPLLYEVRVGDLTGDFKLANDTEVCVFPFPCEEVFCPSFNAKTSMLVDVYKIGVLFSKRQFKNGKYPDQFKDYVPTSIKCERPSR